MGSIYTLPSLSLQPRNMLQTSTHLGNPRNSRKSPPHPLILLKNNLRAGQVCSSLQAFPSHQLRYVCNSFL